MACSKLEARGHLLHKTGTPPKHFSRECTAVNQRNGNLGISTFVHFEMKFLTTLTGILDFANLIFQTGIFFLVWKQTGYFYQFKLYFFPSFWARVKYFDVPCSTIYSLSTIYRDKHYQLLVWWIHYTHCCESKKLKPGKFCLCSLWNNIFNYPNWDFGFC